MTTTKPSSSSASTSASASSSETHMPVPESRTDAQGEVDDVDEDVDGNENESAPLIADADMHRPLRASVQREFDRPAPAWWKRVALVLGIVLAGWLSIRLGKPRKEVVYAQRYSDEFRFRPAGSPIITETLKDGRLRIRGAHVGGQGVRETDVPKSPQQVEHERKLQREGAEKAAKAKLRETRERARKRGKKRA